MPLKFQYTFQMQSGIRLSHPEERSELCLSTYERVNQYGCYSDCCNEPYRTYDSEEHFLEINMFFFVWVAHKFRVELKIDHYECKHPRHQGYIVL